MIRFEQVSAYRGSKRVLHALSFTVHGGQKVGVVGANGAGKSSLFALVTSRLSCDAGEINVPPRLRIAEVEQHSPQGQRSVLDFVLDGWGELRAAEAELARVQDTDDGQRHAQALLRYEDLGGYQAAAQAARILAGLGFAAGEHGRALASFSGGWRVRAALARALLKPSDLLLLDEPTNHLDLDAILWLEEWLTRYGGTALLISHDREFLNHVVGNVLHVAGGRATLYTGDYDDFECARAEALAQEQRAYEKQRAEVAHIHRFVERFRYKASKARQAQSRLKALQRMELIVPAHVDSPFRFGLPRPARMPNPLLVVREASAGYGGAPVISAVNMTLREGVRIGLLGRNGAGKSTFIKLLTGDLAACAGEREASPDLKVGYFAQHGMEQLREEEDALTHLLRADGKLREQQARDILGRYGFPGEDAMRPVATFSGGERARLVLALIFQHAPNLLLLDEPTNHLDLEMRQALAVALQDYAGAIVLVSHDRHLLSSISDELWLVRDGSVTAFDGDLDDYARWLRRGDPTPPRELPSAPRGPARTAVRRKLGYREQRELDALPASIECMEAELHALQSRLADPEFLRQGGEAIARATRELSDKEFELARAYARWDELEADA